MSQKELLQRNAQQVLLGKRTNVLLVKDDVGKAKPTTRDLPSQTFTFGKQDLFPDRETVDKGKLKKATSKVTFQYCSCEHLEIPPELLTDQARPP